MGSFCYVACCFAIFAFCTADHVPEGRNDVVTPFVDYAVRLIGGPDQTQGRFELAVDRLWGTICDEGFSDIDAQVACVSLGFDQNQGTFLGNTYGPGSGEIYFRNYECDGTELAIDDCPHSPFGVVGDCTHSNDVSISCVGIGGYPVRLVGSTKLHEGRLEIQYQGTWGTVCDDGFDVQEAQVACNSLGLGNRGFVVENIFGQTIGPIHLDDVYCLGDETNIGYCTHLPWGDHNCEHSEDIALSCSGLDYAVRLVGGPDHTQGRFELFINNAWGTICDEGFSDIDAQVACVSLGFDQNQGTFLGNTFGPGTGAIYFSNYECDGTELAIDDCLHSPLADVGNCTHDNDVSISCVGVGGYPVRLVGGTQPYEGRLEIQYQGIWGTVCDDFDDRAAQVACSSLGFGNQGYVVDKNFGEATGLIHLDDVDCTGDETNIGYCAHAPWEVHDCVHVQDVAISCSSLDVAARLIGGATPNEGRLEFFLYNEWGTVCDSGFRDIEAQVACNNLGFDVGQGTFLGNQFGPGTGEILIDNVVCDGTEPILNECQHSPIGATNCTHDNDVSISCVGSGYDVRLVGGTETEGRVEVFYRGEWGTICHNYFSNNDARVVCNTLGFGFQGYFVGYKYGWGTGKIWLDQVQCDGNEPNIGSCAHAPWGVNDCVHSSADVSVSCTPADVAVRLVGGTNGNEGRFEAYMYSNSRWGTVCGTGFGETEASVACFNLGFDLGEGTYLGNQFGPGSGDIIFDNVNCTGSEYTLNECQHSPLGHATDCTHDEDVSISCVGSGYPLRLVDGVFPTDGRLEIFYRGEWGSVCTSLFSDTEAQVACRALGYGPRIGRHTGQNKGTGKIWLDDVVCNGFESNIGQCPHDHWGVINSCTNDQDAEISCSTSTGIMYPVRLIGSDGFQAKSSGRLEYFIEDQWGTVCDPAFNDLNAQVACYSLGFNQFEGTYIGQTHGTGSILSPPLLDDVRCTGDEAMIDECSHAFWGIVTCDHRTDVSIQCVGPWPATPVRLVNPASNSTNPTSGRLEIQYYGSWGTVCEDGFTDIEARVACASLGFGYIGSVLDANPFGQGTGKIYLDDVRCAGDELSIGNCRHQPWNTHNCGHLSDVAISCVV